MDTRVFDIDKAAAQSRVSSQEIEAIKAEVAEDFSADQILFELHVVRRIHQLAQERMGLSAWLEQSARRSQEYYRAKGLVETQTADGTILLKDATAQAS